MKITYSDLSNSYDLVLHISLSTYRQGRINITGGPWATELYEPLPRTLASGLYEPPPSLSGLHTIFCL